MNLFFHDQERQIVYAIVGEPQVSELTDGKGRRVGWKASMQIQIARSGNVLVGSQWRDPTSAYPSQTFAPTYRREEILPYFLMRHSPKGSVIDQAEFELLREKYESGTSPGPVT